MTPPPPGRRTGERSEPCGYLLAPLLLAQTESLFNHGALAVAGAAAVAIPIIIHLLTRLRRRPVPWAAMRFLREAFRRHRQRLRVEQLLLLLVRCLIVLLLGLALAGPLVGGIARSLAAGTQSRVVCIVLDDSLTTQVDAGGRARFDQLRDTALTILENLQPGDRVGLWRAAEPAQVMLSPSALDVASARQALQSLAPRYSSADLTGALRLVNQAVADPGLVRAGEPVKVVILSDFSAGSLDLDTALPTEVTQLQQRASIAVATPAPQASNVQIAAFAPRRRTVLAAAGQTPSVAVELRLRRFGDDTGAMTGATMRLVDPETGDPAGSVQREHRWAAGQTEATINAQIPLEVAGDFTGGRVFVVEASITHDGGGDALEADNHRYSTVEWRKRITAAIADDPSDVAAGADGQFAPRDWLALALAPRSEAVNIDPIELLGIEADRIDAAALAALDAVFVTRPDRLTDRGITALDAMAQRGGLVWITPPRGAAPAVWAPPLAEHLKLDMRIGINIAEADQRPWQLAIDATAPPALNLLGADWEALLRPVQVARTLVLEQVPPANVWLALRDQPWLVVHPRGRGAVAVLGSAIDPDWTNLPMRPLFVPLLHEAVRSVLGSSATSDAISGRMPALDERWRGAQRIVRLGGGAQVGVTTGPQGVSLVNPPSRPGVYRADPPARGLQLAVNVDADAGDTRSLDASCVAAHLDATLFDETAPAAMLAGETDRTDIGWPLLWAVLALLLLETALARWFSHAMHSQRGLKLPVPGDAVS